MKNSHKLIFSSVLVMLAAMRPDFASFIPQWIKVALAAVLLVVGFYAMYKERRYWK